MPYEKIFLHRSIVTGSMYHNAAYTKWLFVVCLLECTDGILTATDEYLAMQANLDPLAVEKGLAALMAPDPKSTSLGHDGRRLIPVDGVRNTYRIVNWAIYQPALSSEAKGSKPGITVIDPITGIPIDRLLPNGKPNPHYDKHYQRAYRDHKRKMDAAAKALSDEIDNISVNSVNSDKQDDGNPKAEWNEAPEKVENFNSPDAVEPKTEEKPAENVNYVNNVNKRKGKEKKEINPLTPLEPRKPAGSTKALSKGKPAYDEFWRSFDAAYPRPTNGRQLQKADARITFDALIDSGVMPEDLIAGSRRYCQWIQDLEKGQYVAMMTTWLNQKRWEESWYIHPDSPEGRKISANRALLAENARKEHRAAFGESYELFILDRFAEAVKDETFLEMWEAWIQEKISRRRGGMGVAALERCLTDSEAKATSQREYFDSIDTQRPSFWDWDKTHNPKPFQTNNPS
jgi:hypothetical protein